jgi:hypothetical protein
MNGTVGSGLHYIRDSSKLSKHKEPVGEDMEGTTLRTHLVARTTAMTDREASGESNLGSASVEAIVHSAVG